MNCHKIQNIISAYLDCELPGVEMLAVRQHLSVCVDCRSEFDSTLRLKRAFGRLTSAHPQNDLAARICAQVQSASYQRHESFWDIFYIKINSFSTPVRLAGLAASLAGLIFFTNNMGNNSDHFIYKPISPTVAIGAMGNHNPGNFFAAGVPMMHNASFRINPQPRSLVHAGWVLHGSDQPAMSMVSSTNFPSSGD